MISLMNYVKTLKEPQIEIDHERHDELMNLTRIYLLQYGNVKGKDWCFVQ